MRDVAELQEIWCTCTPSRVVGRTKECTLFPGIADHLALLFQLFRCSGIAGRADYKNQSRFRHSSAVLWGDENQINTPSN